MPEPKLHMRSSLFPPTRGIACAVALLVAIVLVALGAPSASAQKLPDTREGIHVGLVFDNWVRKSKTSATVDLIWGAKRPHGLLGVANGYLIQFDRDHWARPLRWWRKHHPTWIIYRCDRKTPAYEFGDPHVPIDITNPAVRRYQW